MTFLADNWLVLLSLGIALFGGIPGVVGVLEYLRKRPRIGIVETGPC
jgi:hypothetical protein